MTKRCPKCGETKPEDDFARLKTGKLDSWCKACRRLYTRQHYANSPEYRERQSAYQRARWANPEYREKQKAHHRERYAHNPEYRAKVLISTYKKEDKRKGLDFDLDLDWFLENITSQPCYSCGVDDGKNGADRIDNSKGHTHDNVLPCCDLCKEARGDRFTVDDMRNFIGPAIREVLQRRKNKVGRAGLDMLAVGALNTPDQ